MNTQKINIQISCRYEGAVSHLSDAGFPHKIYLYKPDSNDGATWYWINHYDINEDVDIQKMLDLTKGKLVKTIEPNYDGVYDFQLNTDALSGKTVTKELIDMNHSFHRKISYCLITEPRNQSKNHKHLIEKDSIHNQSFFKLYRQIKDINYNAYNNNLTKEELPRLYIANRQPGFEAKDESKTGLIDYIAIDIEKTKMTRAEAAYKLKDFCNISYNSFNNNVNNQKNRYRFIILLDTQYLFSDVKKIKKEIINYLGLDGVDYNASFRDAFMYLPVLFYQRNRNSQLILNPVKTTLSLSQLLIDYDNKPKKKVKQSNCKLPYTPFSVNGEIVNEVYQQERYDETIALLNETGKGKGITHNYINRAGVKLCKAGFSKEDIVSIIENYEYGEHKGLIKRTVNNIMSNFSIDESILRFKQINGLWYDSKLKRYYNKATDKWVVKAADINKIKEIKIPKLTFKGKYFNYKLFKKFFNNEEDFQIALVLLNKAINYRKYIDEYYKDENIEFVYNNQDKFDLDEYQHYVTTNILDDKIIKTFRNIPKGFWLSGDVKRMKPSFFGKIIEERVEVIEEGFSIEEAFKIKTDLDLGNPLRKMQDNYYLKVTFDTFVSKNINPKTGKALWGKGTCLYPNTKLDYSEDLFTIYNKTAIRLNKILFAKKVNEDENN